jgi:argininosuccinate lyase
VPAYTHNVQAQPTTFGHYLLAFAASFQRIADRLHEIYSRVNQSPLGAGALGTSSFAVNRPRLAQLLGFEGVVENSFDANHLAPVEVSNDVANVATSGALTVGAFINDILGQYRHVTPWIVVQEGGLTGTSTMMPQKRNPIVLLAARHQASNVLAEAHGCTLVAHNIGTGLIEHRGNEPLRTLQSAAALYDVLATVLRALKLDEVRARAEIEAEYSTTTELADVLQRDANVPFRVGHHYASQLVNFGRSRGLKPMEIPFVEAVRIYAESARALRVAGERLPLTEPQLRRTLSADNMIAASRGIGGPQPAEVKRMLADRQARLDAHEAWLDEQRRRVSESARALQASFEALRREK